jgi:hypothetical protein
MNEGMERLVDFAATDYRALLRGRLRLYSIYAAAALFAVLAVMALAGSAAIWLASMYGPVAALAMIAGVMAVAAVGFFIAATMMRQAQIRAEAMQKQNRRLAMVGALSMFAGQPSRRSTALLVALGAIFALGRILFGRK